MSGRLRLVFLVMTGLLAVYNISAQSSTSTTTKKPKTTSKTPIAGAGTPAKISIHNLCEKTVSVFAGPRSDIKNPKPKLNAFGGLSNNTVYVKVADVVCLMDEKLKPVSCADVKLDTKTVEINLAGKVVVAK